MGMNLAAPLDTLSTTLSLHNSNVTPVVYFYLFILKSKIKEAERIMIFKLSTYNSVLTQEIYL